MNKITHFFSKIESFYKNFTLTTPNAIVIGAIIIALSLLTLGSMGYEVTIAKTAGKVVQAANPLPSILKAIGVNKNEFAKCVNSGEQAKLVTDSAADGVTAGVNGTPSTFVLREKDGVMYTIANISGAQSKEFFKQAIEQAIAVTDTSKLEKFAGRPINENDFEEVSGPTNVYVVEYSDTECPFCMMLHPTLKELRTEYADKISFVYRHFPLTSIHPHAQKEAEMISCAGKLGGAKAYYSFIDLSFEYKINNNVGFLPWENN